MKMNCHKNIHCSVFGGGIFSRFVQGVVCPLTRHKYENIYLTLRPFTSLTKHQEKFPDPKSQAEMYDKPFNYVFEQKCDDTYEKVSLGIEDFCFEIETHSNFKTYQEIAKRFVLHKSILETVDNKFKDVDLDKTLGVHVRLTTVNHLTKYGIVTIKNYIDAIDKSIKENNYQKICVASDNIESIQKLVDVYGDMIVYNENFNRLPDENYKSTDVEAERFFTEDHWKEAFIDCLMISRCKGLICRTSNFANMALIWGNHSEIQRLWKRG
jgi:hypothetical protein